MQAAGLPSTLCGYGEVIRAWETTSGRDRGGALYLAFTGLREHFQQLHRMEQNMLDTRVRRTSRVLSSILLTIQEIEQTIETVILPMLDPPVQHQLQFFSRSKDRADLGSGTPPNWRKVLSNFHAARLVMGEHLYHTPEHAFHAAKALYSSKPSMALLFIVGGAVGPLATDAKRAGGKGSYKQHGALLDQRRWFDMRTVVQQQIILARLEQHADFRSILTVVGHRNIQLVHFDRTGAKSYWGGSVDALTGCVRGVNRLGTLLTEAASRVCLLPEPVV